MRVPVGCESVFKLVIADTGDRRTSTVLDTCEPLIKQAVNEDRGRHN